MRPIDGEAAEKLLRGFVKFVPNGDMPQYEFATDVIYKIPTLDFELAQPRLLTLAEMDTRMPVWIVVDDGADGMWSTWAIWEHDAYNGEYILTIWGNAYSYFKGNEYGKTWWCYTRPVKIKGCKEWKRN